jgi:hypothetical protein
MFFQDCNAGLTWPIAFWGGYVFLLLNPCAFFSSSVPTVPQPRHKAQANHEARVCKKVSSSVALRLRWQNSMPECLCISSPQQWMITRLDPTLEKSIKAYCFLCSVSSPMMSLSSASTLWDSLWLFWCCKTSLSGVTCSKSYDIAWEETSEILLPTCQDGESKAVSHPRSEGGAQIDATLKIWRRQVAGPPRICLPLTKAWSWMSWGSAF